MPWLRASPSWRTTSPSSATGCRTLMREDTGGEANVCHPGGRRGDRRHRRPHRGGGRGRWTMLEPCGAGNPQPVFSRRRRHLITVHDRRGRRATPEAAGWSRDGRTAGRHLFLRRRRAKSGAGARGTGWTWPFIPRSTSSAAPGRCSCSWWTCGRPPRPDSRLSRLCIEKYSPGGGPHPVQRPGC